MFEAMEQFIKIVELHTFSAAAESLGKSPSSLTRKLDQLEEELKTKLLIRSTRRLELTSDGEQFYNQCKQILESVQVAKHSFIEKRTSVEGTIAITTFDSFGRSVLVPLIAEFRDTHPNTKVTIGLDNTIADLHKSPFDIAIRYGRPDDSNLIFRPLKKMPSILIASEHYLEKAPPLESPDDLKLHSCLAFYKSRQHTWWYFEKNNEQRKVRIDPTLTSEGGTPLLMWARANQGIALVSKYFVERDLKNGSLIEVLPTWNASLTEQDNAIMYLVWKASSAQKPIVRAMIDLIMNRVANE
ncbi:LysR family transcriptional regulator [Marinomonas mediterranea]|jgi:Transcriptional regulator|uniref:Transcriptional regulator, LysR family n=1 Tax=Marinomonas mediterranea (strain ATCC 700492 / JCM 21426 / NBRC 103028 / MMB-1) TaxID=717774 RepID=F2JU38_MARM1|nr:LysR family transcriptional regulator [Marinomonas mediterranea]ADZ91550.1 transcriptional regulator, LysR family [Marinomonas mediterranea MMB-1]WCN17654.1 LysR family transcriptional regulator [Marinomonas mediterranea MMB-1]